MDYNKMLKILDHKNANKPLMGVWVKKNIRLCMNCYFVMKEFDLLKQRCNLVKYLKKREIGV